MQFDINEKEKICDTILSIIKNGNEAVVRKRSKNGEGYLEIVEQKLTVKGKTFTATKN